MANTDKKPLLPKTSDTPAAGDSGSRVYTPGPQRESTDSGIVSPERDEIVKQHAREHPEGDPAVRRVKPDRGTIPIEEPSGSGTMKVSEPDRNAETPPHPTGPNTETGTRESGKPLPELDKGKRRAA